MVATMHAARLAAVTRVDRALVCRFTIFPPASKICVSFLLVALFHCILVYQVYCI